MVGVSELAFHAPEQLLVSNHHLSVKLVTQLRLKYGSTDLKLMLPTKILKQPSHFGTVNANNYWV
jgi:hypothetical protein